MKRLICEADVLAAAKSHATLEVDANTLVTAQARDVAKELGVEFCDASASAPAQAPVICHAAKPSTHSCPSQDPALSPEEIEKLTHLALERGIWSEDDLSQILCGLGRHK